VPRPDDLPLPTVEVTDERGSSVNFFIESPERRDQTVLAASSERVNVRSPVCNCGLQSVTIVV
jgi:hypothetical protein